MAVTRVKQLEVEQRRLAVAEGLARGLTVLRDLAFFAGAAPSRAEVTAAQIATACKDVQAVRKEWARNRVADVSTMIDEQEFRLNRLIRKAERQFVKSCKPSRKRTRKFDWALTSNAESPEPEVRTDDGVLIREETAGKPAVYQRVVTEETVTIEERPGDVSYLRVIRECLSDLAKLKGLGNGTPEGAMTPAIVQFNIVAPASMVPQLQQVLPVPPEPITPDSSHLGGSSSGPVVVGEGEVPATPEPFALPFADVLMTPYPPEYGGQDPYKVGEPEDEEDHG